MAEEMRVREPHAAIFPSSPPCLPKHSVLPDRVRPRGLRRTGERPGRGWSWAEPGPKEEEQLTWVRPGGWGLAWMLFEDRHTLHSERDRPRFTSSQLGPRKPELRDP